MVAFTASALFSCLEEDLLSDRQVDPPSIQAKVSLRNSLMKKFVSVAASDADARAMEKFLVANLRCREFGRSKTPGLFDSLLLGHFREEMHKFFEPNNRGPLVSSFEDVFSSSRVGPGSTIGTDNTDLYNKLYNSDLTASSEKLFRYYRSYVEHHPELLKAETSRLENGFSCVVVPGSRLSFVPKNDEISRVICIEPSLNIFFQLGIGTAITRRLKAFCNIDISPKTENDGVGSEFSSFKKRDSRPISFSPWPLGNDDEVVCSQQDVNRELARIGSLDDRLVTIDLESASDSISWKMILAFAPRSLWTWLWSLRSPSVELPDGSQVQAHMVSSMGNGFTFPLQTAIFACIVRASYAFAGKRVPNAGKDWSVYGDDIIVNKEICPMVLHLLDLLGFTVNASKSFFQGPFRESCGADYYVGRNVRGVYLKDLATPQSLCTAINLLNRWSARTGIYLSRTITYLLEFHGGLKALPLVPRWENDDAGVKVPFVMVKDLRRSKRFQSVLYWRFSAKPAKVFFSDISTFWGAKQRRSRLNEAGALRAFLAGVLEGRKAGQHPSVTGTISVRHNTTFYRRTTGVAPFWDSDFGDPLGKDVNPRDWKYHALANLKD
jgi:hypothetical protein